MRAERFEEVVEKQFQICRDVLLTKSQEYATGDRLHNFKQAGAMQGISPMQALSGMMAKHTISLYDMLGVNSDKPHTREMWNEKITDSINYLLLLQGLLGEQDDEFKQRNETLYADNTPLVTVNRGDIPLTSNPEKE